MADGGKGKGGGNEIDPDEPITSVEGRMRVLEFPTRRPSSEALYEQACKESLEGETDEDRELDADLERRLVLIEEMRERARLVLAGRSRSYVVDAQDFARFILRNRRRSRPAAPRPGRRSEGEE